MDLDWTEDERAFRAELREFIGEHRRPGWTHRQREMPEPEDRAAVLEFCGAMGAQGLLTPHWPIEYGGRQASPWEQTIVSEELWAAGEPRGPQYMNVNWIGPAIMLAGTGRAEAVPSRPHRQRGGHVVPGLLRARGRLRPRLAAHCGRPRRRRVHRQRPEDLDVLRPRRRLLPRCWCGPIPTTTGGEGISILLVPMDLPGIEVRDIPNPWVTHLVHETWFTDVPVPVSCRLGEENEGWEIVRQVLANERVGIARHECAERTLDAAVAWAEASGTDVDDPSVAEVIGMAYATCEAARALNYAAVHERTLDRDSRRPMAAVSRSVTGPMEGRVAQACLEVARIRGPRPPQPGGAPTRLGHDRARSPPAASRCSST